MALLKNPIAFRCRRLACAATSAALLAGCGTSSSSPSGEDGGGVTVGGGAGERAVGGQAGLGGSSGSSGSAGAGLGGGGAAGASLGGAGDGGGSRMGIQMDPGAVGDGRFDVPMPYDAPAESLERSPGVPTGTVDLMTQNLYESKTVYPGLKFQYWLYVPAQYQAGKPAALMVFQDGVHYLGLSDAKFNSHFVFDNLIAKGDMPVTIGLFVNPGVPSGVYDSSQKATRSMEYDTPSDRYSKFLLEELIPDVVSSRYDIVDDPNGWAISGHSSGGICAFMAGWYRPDKFRKLLTHNASFPLTQNVFPAAIGTTATKPLRVMLLSSPKDIGETQAGKWFDTNNKAAELLASQGYHYRYAVGNGPHYPPTQAVADYVNALRWLWRGYSLPWYSSQP